MKKILLLAVISLSLSACTINEYYECPEEHLVSDTYYITVYPSNWSEVNGDGNFYIYATKSLPAISKDVIEEGSVSAYYIETYDHPLPYVRPYATTFFETIRCELENEKISFIIENNDEFLPPIPGDYNMEFKVVVFRTIYHE